MSRRISLTRIIALNWYGFRQIFDVSDNILMSGAFGTGKSALLDLVQYVLLGEHWRANRAAAGNARGRDLVGYCLGDTNQTRNGQRHFLRSSGVTLVGLEFTRAADSPNEAPKRETWGIRLEYRSPDSAPAHTYFLIPDRLEYAAVAPEGKLLSDDEFRRWVRREFDPECIFSRQRDYLEEMAAPRHLNFDATAFQRTFPKAIAFELEESVEKFIREFILEESPLDVREVRAALHAYDETRRRLEKQEDEAEFLRRICRQHQRSEDARREAALLRHIDLSLRHVQTEERHARHAAEIQRLEEAHAAEAQELSRARADEAEVGRMLEDVRFQIQRDPQDVQLDQLERQRRELQARITGLREAQKSVAERLTARLRCWDQWLQSGANLPLEGLAKALTVDRKVLTHLREGKVHERLEATASLASRFGELTTAARELLRPLEDRLRSLAHLRQQLAQDLENLAKGRAPGAFPVFQAIRQKLGDRAEQLARLIEVNPEAERWWPALELFLGRSRWVIVVNDGGDYREALDILRKTPSHNDGEALLHPSEVQDLRSKSQPGSLASKVTVTHPVAKPYVEYLLGDVVCVDNLRELEATAAPRAITPEGIFKQKPLRRRLKGAGNVALTLGRVGLERMKAAKLQEQEEARLEYEALERRLADVQAWLERGRRDGLGEPVRAESAGEFARLPELERELGTLRETINLLSTPEREARQKRLAELESDRANLLRRIGALADAHLKFELPAQREREAMAAAAEEMQDALLEAEKSRLELARRYPGVTEAELQQRRDDFQRDHPKWPERYAAISAAASRARETAAEAREKRNTERILLASARDAKGDLRHPEYQADFSADDEDNDAWSMRLQVLETVELEKSRELAADRQREWERRLEENVLNELNRRIAAATDTIRLLDRYLSQPVGRFRYRISQRKDQAAYGAIWSLLQTGLEVTDPLLAAIPDEETQRAKEELMKAIDAPDNSEDRVRRLLDYRFYHRYDIEMVPADKPDAPPISLSRSGRNLSGGESQAPFFVSMLAAFRRVYDRGSRDSIRSQQLGLVVMDEAFSKLSGDGIEDCLALARTFQLQLVMAFPPERLGVMVPHAQTVVICQKEVKRDKEGYVTQINNIPLVATMAQAMEALG